MFKQILEEIKKYTGAMRIMENSDYYIEERDRFFGRSIP